MKPCLDDSELLHLLIADDGEYLDERVHLSGCSQCTERYEEMARDAITITSTVTHAADHLRSRESPAVERLRIGDGFRMAAIFSGAAAFGGATAFALLLALGWRPAAAQNQIASVSGSTFASASVSKAEASNSTVATNEAAGTRGSVHTLHAAQAIIDDPIVGLVYSDSLTKANTNPYEDMLFCVPEEDGTICSSSSEQG